MLAARIQRRGKLVFEFNLERSYAPNAMEFKQLAFRFSFLLARFSTLDSLSTFIFYGR